jgi:hypothetical protein
MGVHAEAILRVLLLKRRNWICRTISKQAVCNQVFIHMTEAEEEAYIYAQDRTRLRIAIDVLKEVICDDFQVKDIVAELHRQVEAAYEKRDT